MTRILKKIEIPFSDMHYVFILKIRAQLRFCELFKLGSIWFLGTKKENIAAVDI